MGYSTNTLRQYRTKYRKLMKARNKITDPALQAKVEAEIARLADILGKELREYFEHFMEAKPGRPALALTSEELATATAAAKESVEEKKARLVEEFRKKYESGEEEPSVDAAALQASEEALMKLLNTPIVQETNRGHEDKDREPEATYYFSWVTWAD